LAGITVRASGTVRLWLAGAFGTGGAIETRWALALSIKTARFTRSWTALLGSSRGGTTGAVSVWTKSAAGREWSSSRAIARLGAILEAALVVDGMDFKFLSGTKPVWTITRAFVIEGFGSAFCKLGPESTRGAAAIIALKAIGPSAGFRSGVAVELWRA